MRVAKGLRYFVAILLLLFLFLIADVHAQTIDIKFIGNYHERSAISGASDAESIDPDSRIFAINKAGVFGRTSTGGFNYHEDGNFDVPSIAGFPHTYFGASGKNTWTYIGDDGDGYFYQDGSENSLPAPYPAGALYMLRCSYSTSHNCIYMTKDGALYASQETSDPNVCGVFNGQLPFEKGSIQYFDISRQGSSFLSTDGKLFICSTNSAFHENEIPGSGPDEVQSIPGTLYIAMNERFVLSLEDEGVYTYGLKCNGDNDCSSDVFDPHFEIADRVYIAIAATRGYGILLGEDGNVYVFGKETPDLFEVGAGNVPKLAINGPIQAIMASEETIAGISFPHDSAQAGKMVDGETDVADCPKGFYCPSFNLKIHCPAATWTYSAGSSSLSDCNPLLCSGSCLNGVEYTCDNGAYPDWNAGECRACDTEEYSPDGKACIPCPAGQYPIQVDVDSMGNDDCKPCPAGLKCSGADGEVPCEAGKYSLAGDLECHVCPAGYYPTKSDSELLGNDQCTICPIGSGCNGEVRNVCIGNKYHIGGEGRPACEFCSPGHRTIRHASNEYNIDCVLCLAGTACDGTESKEVCDGNSFSEYDESEECVPCDAGYYTSPGSAVEGNTRCTICPAGSKCPDGDNIYKCRGNSYSGSTGFIDCVPCVATKYVTEAVPGEGFTDCVNCPTGHSCPNGRFAVPCTGSFYATTGSLDECDECGPGKYTIFDSAAGGNTQCVDCPVGKYCNGVQQLKCEGNKFSRKPGASSCDTCAPGYYTVSANDDGNTDCLVCPPGFECPNGIDKIACVGKKYSAYAFSESCEDCGAGMYAFNTEGQEGNNACYQCPIGYECPDGELIACANNKYSDETDLDECKTCAAGTVAVKVNSVDAGGVPAGNDRCEPCPAGAKCPSGDLERCLGAEYQENSGSTICVPCGAGNYTVSNSVGNIACLPCEEGFKCDGENKIACDSGKQYTDAPQQVECSDCPAGTIPKADRTGCDPCPAGSFCDGEVATFCTGKLYSASTEAPACSICPIGSKTSGETAHNGNTACTPCTGSVYCDGETETDCPAGSYTVPSADGGNILCVACPAGHKCSGDGSKIKCDNNRYAPGTGYADCLPCPGGSYAYEEVDGQGKTACTLCPVGSSCDGAEPTKCTGSEYAAFAGREFCATCPPGSYTSDPNGQGNSVCTKCPIGKYCDGTSALSCENNFYAPVTGLATCQKCDAGFFTSNPTGQGNSVCTPCPIGYECDGKTQTACTGKKYSSVMQKGICDTCDNGYFTTSVAGANTACVACPKGFECDGEDFSQCTGKTYSNTTANTLGCQPCSDGHYLIKDSNGYHIDCLPCPKGERCNGDVKIACTGATFSNATQQSICTDCNAGYYTIVEDDAAGYTNCLICEEGYGCDGEKRVRCTGKKYATGTANAKCHDCNEGNFVTVNANGESIACSPCPVGMFCDGLEATACEGNEYAKGGASNCTECLSGFHVVVDENGKNVDCVPCVAGTECPNGIDVVSCTGKKYAPDAQTGECLVCPPGNYVVTGSDGNIDCVTCPLGSECDGEAVTVCEGNQFANVTGLARCYECPTGSKTTEEVEGEGNTACTPCAGDKYCDGDNEFDCPRGYYTVAENEGGNSLCVECPLGSACDGQNVTLCTGVFYANETGLPECHKCETGFFTSKNETLSGSEESGNILCSACPQGWYCEDGIERHACPSGEFTSEEGTDSPSFCSAEFCPDDYDCVGGILVYAPKKSQTLSIVFIVLGGVLLLALAAVVVGGVVLLVWFLRPRASAAAAATAAAAEMSKI